MLMQREEKKAEKARQEKEKSEKGKLEEQVEELSPFLLGIYSSYHPFPVVTSLCYASKQSYLFLLSVFQFHGVPLELAIHAMVEGFRIFI